MSIAKIFLPVAKLFPLDYLIPDNLELQAGDLVIVPFKNQELTGIVWKIEAKSNLKKLKAIKDKVPLNGKLSSSNLDFISWATNYYLTEYGSITKLVLPVNIAEKPLKIKQQDISGQYALPTLSEEQIECLKQVQAADKPVVIRGVTGSGKTEIYFHLIGDYLKQGKQVLLMLPEISLSQQIIQRFTQRFNFEPIVWHSGVTNAQKRRILRGIIDNQAKIVIGTRSSLFLPYPNLGLIVIDEEQDSSYKQEEGILYNARDMAVLRGYLSDVKIVLASATPSIETIYNANISKYQLIDLPTRYKEAQMPEVKLIDMRNQKLAHNCWISEPLIAAIRNNLASKQQTLLFLNRRGYAPLMLCKICGYRFMCTHCSAWLILHKASKKLECHHCGYHIGIPRICPDCSKENTLTCCGPGIERIAEEAQSLFPNSNIAVMSKDQLLKPHHVIELLNKMTSNEIDILIGTQLIAKGYHFPYLTLVGVIDADIGFIGGDLKASERTFQLLHQVGGRAGREDKKGQALIQTYYPDNLILNSLKEHTTDKFINYELASREASQMPPFTKIACLILSSKSEEIAKEISTRLVSTAPASNIKILGPAKASMLRLAGKYRYRILVIAPRRFNLPAYLQTWLGSFKMPSNCQIKVDIDPQNFC